MRATLDGQRRLPAPEADALSTMDELATVLAGVERYEEAKATGAEVLAVGCPFCMQMFETAKSSVADGPVIKDVAELVAERLPEQAAVGN